MPLILEFDESTKYLQQIISEKVQHSIDKTLDHTVIHTSNIEDGINADAMNEMLEDEKVKKQIILFTTMSIKDMEDYSIIKRLKNIGFEYQLQPNNCQVIDWVREGSLIVRDYVQNVIIIADMDDYHIQEKIKILTASRIYKNIYLLLIDCVDDMMWSDNIREIEITNENRQEFYKKQYWDKFQSVIFSQKLGLRLINREQPIRYGTAGMKKTLKELTGCNVETGNFIRQTIEEEALYEASNLARLVREGEKINLSPPGACEQVVLMRDRRNVVNYIQTDKGTLTLFKELQETDNRIIRLIRIDKGKEREEENKRKTDRIIKTILILISKVYQMVIRILDKILELVDRWTKIMNGEEKTGPINFGRLVVSIRRKLGWFSHTLEK